MEQEEEKNNERAAHPLHANAKEQTIQVDIAQKTDSTEEC